MRPKLMIACVVLCLGLISLGTSESSETRFSAAPRPVSVKADIALAAVSRDAAESVLPGLRMPLAVTPPEALRSPLLPPGEGTNWVLGQNILYPSPGAANRMLGPLCFYNTRKVISGDGDLFVAGWESGSENDNEVMVTRWDDFFGLWTNPSPLSQSITDAGRLDVALGADGTVHAAWHQNYTTSVPTYEVFYSRLPAGGFAWSPPVRVSLADAYESNFPNVGVDSEGHVTVRWADLLRDAAGNILAYRGYAVNTSVNNGVTWSDANVEWATQDTLKLYGAMCVDQVSGDIYLVDADPESDPTDEYADILVYHYDKATDTWEGPEIVAYGGGVGEPLHACLYPSAAAGLDGTIYILYSQTTNADPGYIWTDYQVGQPIAAQLFIINGTYGNWSAPEPIYPGTDGVYPGYEGAYPDSTWLQFCSFAQVGLSAGNGLYVATRSYEYYNGAYLTGFGDMYSNIGGTEHWQPEEWIACKDLTTNDEWVWTRGSDINLRPDTIGVKYSKLPQRLPTSGACAVWDESYNGTRPERVMFVRLTDFTSPSSVTGLMAQRPDPTGPVTLSWTNPSDADLGGIRIIRTTTGKAHLVGLRRGMIPVDDSGQWLYDPETDVFLLEPDPEMPDSFVDPTPPLGTVFYTLVPFDSHLHHLYPIPDQAVVRVDGIALGGNLTSGAVELTWSSFAGTSQYWIYGAANMPWFVPGTGPGYEYRVAIVVPPTTTWSSSAGVGDPESNWTYLVMAVNASEQELATSNRIGEEDFGYDIP